MNPEETQPRRTDVFPEEHDYDEGDSGPGCLIWGMVGLFGIILAIGIVAVAALAGFNEGITTGQTTAIAVTNQYVQAECSQLPTDIAMNRVQIVQQRYDKWQQLGEIPACAQAYIPQATMIYQQSIITDTPMPTATPTSTETPLPQDTPIPTEAATQNGGYDLGELLVEAQNYISDNNYPEAIRTLDAIVAIDPEFQKETISALLFNALRQRATTLYQSTDGSLAEAILLTNRAEQYGDVGNLNYERTVAQYYLDAQAFINVNYSQAITLLSQVISLSQNYPRGTGRARQQLIEQYIAYGDALVLGADPCTAVEQYNAVLQLSPNRPEVQTKLDDAQTQCTFGFAGTADPNATSSPAPVGVGGG